MKAAVKKHISEMIEDELKEVLRRDYVRKLTRYRMTDDFYKRKYGRDFANFQEANIVAKEEYSNLMPRNGSSPLTV
jgi:hypothetical protein